MGSVFSRIKKGLTKTREKILGIFPAPGEAKNLEEFLERVEESLILADTGVDTALFVVEEVKERLRGKNWDEKAARDAVVDAISDILGEVESPLQVEPPFPFVVLVLGVNGSGKTTTIGKMAALLKESGRSVLLGAADTFRAAAIDQLEIWGERVGVPVVKHSPGADASAVAFDAVRAARARGIDVVIIDTAGRLHTKKNLMEELKKVKRVVGKEVSHAPSEVLLVIDATTGLNGLSQARVFHEELGVTGIAVTKLDGTAKGGIILAISRELKIPVRFVGVGEGVEDLREFRARPFAEALFLDE